MLETLTVPELTEWLAFDQLEPLGDSRVTILLSRLLALTANLERDRKQRPEPYDAEKMIPFIAHDLAALQPESDKDSALRKSIEAGRKAMRWLLNRNV